MSRDLENGDIVPVNDNVTDDETNAETADDTDVEQLNEAESEANDGDSETGSKGIEVNVLNGQTKANNEMESEEDESITKEEEEESNWKKKAFFLICCLLLFFGAGGAAAYFLFLDEDDSNTARVIVSDPTFSPSIEATTPPSIQATEVPTSVTAAPSTPSPTFDTSQPISIRSCSEIVADETLHIDPGIPFKSNFTLPDGTLLCGDTYVGFPRNPDRNPWTARLGQTDCEKFDFDRGTEICQSVGARRCTADELQFGAAQGTGCNGDNDLLYTNTTCTENGQDGYLKINLQLKKDFATFFECETNLSNVSLVRCCADFF